MRITHAMRAAAVLTVLAGVGEARAQGGEGGAPPAGPGRGFVNFETPHVHPLEVTPDGTVLLAVNTPDNRLEVFDLVDGRPVRRGSVPVGLDPVSVRANGDAEAWVVNNISDSVSVVNLRTMSVVRTLATKDEPWDVVFGVGVSGNGARTRAFVSTGTFNTIQVFDFGSLGSGGGGAPSFEVVLAGEQPRALAVSPDGRKVYCAIFESGNRSTVLGGGGMSARAGRISFPPNVVSDPAGPWLGQNPPPNAGSTFFPALSPDASTPLPVGLIVKQNAQGRWMDDNGGDWTSLVSGSQAGLSGRPVGWTLTDHDCAVVDSVSLATTYVDGLMNICMAVGVNPASGRVHVVGTDAINQVRYEPNVRGRFVRVRDAWFDSSAGSGVGAPTGLDLNPHLDYASSQIDSAARQRSVGDPRGIAFHPSGSFGYVAGMGSGAVVRIDSAGQRTGVDVLVGEGPTGLAFSPDGARLYVMNKFSASVSVVDPSAGAELERVSLFDPSPVAIKKGRKHLYDTHANSGLGQAACASCHVDAKMDRLAWDLGDPSGAAAPLTDRNLGFGVPFLTPATAPTPYSPYHPMKGPMLTQTFQDIVGHEPFHWRGDRLGLEEFNGAFVSLQGAERGLTSTQMQEFEDFLATIAFPPNPFRNFDNTLPTSLPLPGHYTTGRFAAAGQPLPSGDAQAGLSLYRDTTRRMDGAFACVTCHTLPTGMGPDMVRSSGLNGTYQPIPVGPLGEHHLGLVSIDGSTNTAIKVPQLRNLYKRRGFNATQTANRSGAGLLHDGSIDSIERFVAEPAFNVQSDAEVANLVALMLAFSGSDLPQGSASSTLEPPGPPSKDAHAAVGAQVTLTGVDPAAISRANSMVALAQAGKIGLVAKGRLGGVQRGFAYAATGVFQSDRASQAFTPAQLFASASIGGEITLTATPAGSEIRIGIDRDSDGWFDRDELDVCSDPSNPASYPGGAGSIDFNGDLSIDPDDLADFIGGFFATPPDPRCDFNADGFIDPDDLSDFIGAFFARC